MIKRLKRQIMECQILIAKTVNLIYGGCFIYAVKTNNEQKTFRIKCKK